MSFLKNIRYISYRRIIWLRITQSFTNKENSDSLETRSVHICCAYHTHVYTTYRARWFGICSFKNIPSMLSYPLTSFYSRQFYSPRLRIIVLRDFTVLFCLWQKSAYRQTGAIQEKRVARGRRVGSRAGGALMAWSNWPTCARCSPPSVASSAVLVTVSEWLSHCVLHTEQDQHLSGRSPLP